MHIPFDAKAGVRPQNDRFLYQERWGFAGTPKAQYPLLLHFHPLVIYRHQVLKQSDVVMAMYLMPDGFTDDDRRRNFDYCEPLTTDDETAPFTAHLGGQVCGIELTRDAATLHLRHGGPLTVIVNAAPVVLTSNEPVVVPLTSPASFASARPGMLETL